MFMVVYYYACCFNNGENALRNCYIMRLDMGTRYKLNDHETLTSRRPPVPANEVMRLVITAHSSISMIV